MIYPYLTLTKLAPREEIGVWRCLSASHVTVTTYASTVFSEIYQLHQVNFWQNNFLASTITKLIFVPLLTKYIPTNEWLLITSKFSLFFTPWSYSIPVAIRLYCSIHILYMSRDWIPIYVCRYDKDMIGEMITIFIKNSGGKMQLQYAGQEVLICTYWGKTRIVQVILLPHLWMWS